MLTWDFFKDLSCSNLGLRAQAFEFAPYPPLGAGKHRRLALRGPPGSGQRAPWVTIRWSASVRPRPRGGGSLARPPPQLVCRVGNRGPERLRHSGLTLLAWVRRRAPGAPGAQGARSGAGRGRGTLCLNHTATARPGAAGAEPARRRRRPTVLVGGARRSPSPGHRPPRRPTRPRSRSSPRPLWRPARAPPSSPVSAREQSACARRGRRASARAVPRPRLPRPRAWARGRGGAQRATACRGSRRPGLGGSRRRRCLDEGVGRRERLLSRGSGRPELGESRRRRGLDEGAGLRERPEARGSRLPGSMELTPRKDPVTPPEWVPGVLAPHRSLKPGSLLTWVRGPSALLLPCDFRS